jgi:hypothetical protein
MLILAALGCFVAVIGVRDASAEIVARRVADGMLALDPKGTPSVAYVRGTNALISTRAKNGNWRAVKAGRVSSGSTVKAFKIGKNGPVALVQSADDRSLVAVRRRVSGWQTVRIVPRVGMTFALGWPGLTFDREGLPVVAYTRWNSLNLHTQLLLVRIDARGRTSSQRITAEGFPQSDVPPPAAPVVVGGRVHVVESFGYRTLVGAFEWYPDKKTWTGLGLDVTRGEFPLGPLLAGLLGGKLYAAWTQSLYALGAAPVTLAERANTASADFLLERALTTALALPASGAEVAANEWVGADELGLDGDGSVWAGTVISRTSEVQLDGWIGGLAVAPNAGRDLLLERGGDLEWFRSPRKLSTRVSIGVVPEESSVLVDGRVEGASKGKVTIFRERPGARRELAGTAQLSDGSFSFVDRTTSRPLLYRAVYTDAGTSIPYAALSRPIR